MEEEEGAHNAFTTPLFVLHCSDISKSACGGSTDWLYAKDKKRKMQTLQLVTEIQSKFYAFNPILTLTLLTLASIFPVVDYTFHPWGCINDCIYAIFRLWHVTMYVTFLSFFFPPNTKPIFLYLPPK